MAAKSMTQREAEYRGELNALESRRKTENRSFNEAESQRVNELLELCDQVKEERTQKMATALAEERTGSYSGGPRDPVTNPDGKRYSLLRAIDLRSRGLQVDGYEGEISQEIAKRSGRASQGFFMPLALPMPAGDGERRALDTTAGAGGVQTSFLGSRFIDALRNKMVLTALGATLLTDVVGDLQIPKQTGGGTAYWLDEEDPITPSAQAIGQVAFTPTTVAAFTDITRRMVKQTSLDVELLTRNDLLQVIAVEVDRAGINGSGSGAEPQGIMQNGSITTVAIGTNGGDPTWDKIVELESSIAAANADVGSLGYLTSCFGRGKLKTTPKQTGYPTYLWDNGSLNGYRSVATNQVPSNLTKGSGTNLTALLFADWSALYVATWGAVDVLVDPYTNSTTGAIRVRTMLDCAIRLRRVEAFAKIVDMAR